jgi:hypothetical protein
MKTVACARNYPNPGGRISLLQQLKNIRPDMEIIDFSDLKEPFRKQKYGLKCFSQLRKLNPEVVLGLGVANELPMLYARLYGKKGIYNMSGFRFKVYNIFNYNVLSELASIFLCDQVIVPSDDCRERILSYLPFLSSKIKVIHEGVTRPARKKHRGMNIGFTRTEPEFYKEVYGPIIQNAGKFDDANLYFIKQRTIELLKDGSLTELKGKRMKDVLPELDALFILARDYNDYHSSTLLEAISVGIPFFVTPISHLKKEIDTTPFRLRSASFKEVLSKYQDLRKRPMVYQKVMENIQKKIVPLYDLEKTLRLWQKEI